MVKALAIRVHLWAKLKRRDASFRFDLISFRICCGVCLTQYRVSTDGAKHTDSETNKLWIIPVREPEYKSLRFSSFEKERERERERRGDDLASRLFNFIIRFAVRLRQAENFRFIACLRQNAQDPVPSRYHKEQCNFLRKKMLTGYSYSSSFPSTI